MTDLISIDGACYHNGKPDSFGVGACVVAHNISGSDLLSCEKVDRFLYAEYISTNQRAEIMGLIAALKYIIDLTNDDTAIIVTDSEYILNAINNNWPANWSRKGWLKADGEPVKNKDLWETALKYIEAIKCELVIYHIKGHSIPIGAVTRDSHITNEDCKDILNVCIEKYDIESIARQDAIAEVQKCAVKNNYAEYQDDTLRAFIVMNMVADCVASKVVDDYKKCLF